MNRYLSLAAFVGLVVLVALASGQFMPGAWYAGLIKPAWTPPNWLFGPVWSVLYLMIAVAGWLAWQARATGNAHRLWAIQLLLNGIWTPVMFGLHQIGWAVVIITLLWLVIAAFVASTWRETRTAALLFLPYLAWVSYAASLNIALWRLNP